MRSGGMRHRVTIEEVTEGRNSFGEVTKTWGTYATRWASIEPVSGREYFQAKRENTENDVRIRLRWDRRMTEVTTKMRVTYGYPILEESPERTQTRVFDIEAVLNLREKNREVVLMCREIL